MNYQSCFEFSSNPGLNIEKFEVYLRPQNRRVKQNNIKELGIMTKADIVAEISEKTGIEKVQVQATIEVFMDSVKNSLSDGENVYLRGFGSFIVKERAEKTGRNISRNTTIIIPAHNIPAFKPAKTFVSQVKDNVKV